MREVLCRYYFDSKRPLKGKSLLGGLENVLESDEEFGCGIIRLKEIIKGKSGERN